MNRVLIFIGSLTAGGAERVTVALSRYLAEHGHPVCVVTMHERDRDFYELDRRVDRVCLGLAGSNHGFHKIPATLARIRALRSVAREQEADVVIGMMSSSAVLAILACLGLRVHVIASERNYPGRKSADKPWAVLRRLCYRLADAHVAQTRKGADWLRSHTGSRCIRVIPNSVHWPVPSVPPRIPPDELLEPGARAVLAVGSKVEQKGFDLLVDAFASVAARYGDWHLVILGLDPDQRRDEADLERLRRQLARHDLQERVHLPGRVGNIGDWYRRAELFVLSSRYEGFPNALLEAMAGGCASVAFDCETGPRDIVEHDENGLLVPAENVGALADAMASLMGDPERRRRLGESALAVRSRFSEERVLGEWKRLIDGAAQPDARGAEAP